MMMMMMMMKDGEKWLPSSVHVDWMYVAAYGCCMGDTFASELGILSKEEPRLITQLWKRVPAGTNGGITVVGTVAALTGGLLLDVVLSVTTMIMKYTDSPFVLSNIPFGLGLCSALVGTTVCT
jgi:uncharacterized protein (TIGR00297 family)